MSYVLLDSGNQSKLERFGDFVLSRPCAGAVWRPRLSRETWDAADATFTREGSNRWIERKRLPKEWTAEIAGVRFKIAPTDFGHLGVFPEHHILWNWMVPLIQERNKPSVLNLFAYSGGATMAAAQAGAQVCHLDASKGMVSWARENAALNRLNDAPIRWIVDDVMKFLKREIKRGTRYDGIILDPPSFGRGNQGEVFKFERDLPYLLELCRGVLSDNPLFMILSCHTPGITPLVLQHLLEEMLPPGKLESQELVIPGDRDLPLGSFARWRPC